MAEEVVLLDFWPSLFGMRVRIALREKGVEYESRLEENLLSGKKSSLLLQMNPVHKKVPVLIHNGRPVCESLVIVEYIDETWNDKAPLLPSDPHERARARFWADYVDKKIFTVGRSVWWGAKSDKEAEEAGKQWIACCKVLEAELGDDDYFGGRCFGFVDVAFVPFSAWFYTIETLGKVSVADECPKLVGWAQRCMQRESVSKSLPDQREWYGFLVDFKKRRQAAKV